MFKIVVQPIAFKEEHLSLLVASIPTRVSLTLPLAVARERARFISALFHRGRFLLLFSRSFPAPRPFMHVLGEGYEREKERKIERKREGEEDINPAWRVIRCN